MKSLAECVARISASPADLSIRLDLADLFEKQRKPKLAGWMREGLAISNSLAPIGCTYPTCSVWGSVSYSSYVCPGDSTVQARRQSWKTAFPDYWRTPEQCAIGEYYGRWIISCWATNSPSNREQVDELAGMTWLSDLYQDGLLELVEYNFGSAETAEWAFAWPNVIQSLPFSLNAARAHRDGCSRDLSRRLLSWPTLVGLYLTLGTFPAEAVAQLPDLAPGLQFVSVEFERRTRIIDEIIQAVPHWRQIRLLSLLGPIKLADEDLTALLKTSSLSAFGTNSRHLTRANLFTLGRIATLKWLGINSDMVTRADLNEFRIEFPRVQLFLSRDMQARLGPC